MRLQSFRLFSILCCSVLCAAATNPEVAYWQEYYRKNLESMALQYRYELNALKLGLHERDFAIIAYRNNIESLEATVSFQRQIIQFLTRRFAVRQNESEQYLSEDEQENFYEALEHQSQSR